MSEEKTIVTFAHTRHLTIKMEIPTKRIVQKMARLEIDSTTFVSVQNTTAEESGRPRQAEGFIWAYLHRPKLMRSGALHKNVSMNRCNLGKYLGVTQFL